MKIKSLLLAASLLCAFALNLSAQTNQPPGTNALPPVTVNSEAKIILDQLPTTGLSQEKVGVGLGTVMRNDQTFSAVTFIDYDVKTNIYLRGEVDEGTTGNGIEGVAIGGGYAHTTSAARIYTVTEVRRNFATTPLAPKAGCDGIIGAGIAYAPSTNTLAKFSLGAEQRMVVPIQLQGGQNTSPRSETVAYARYSF